jgi:hypothetical protein
MSHKDGRVVLSAWVDPVLRDYAREAARLSGLEFSRWVERAVRQAMVHEWAPREPEGWSACSRCGMVRNYDRERPCRGAMPEIKPRDGSAS